MNEPIIALIYLVLLVVVYFNMTKPPFKRRRSEDFQLFVGGSGAPTNNGVPPNPPEIVNALYSDILDIFQSDTLHKRERLAFALHNISEYIDPGDFLEEHDEIRRYIFGMP